VSSRSLATRSLQERFYHPELDVLRFFAFFLVFLHHSLPHEISFYSRMGVAAPVASLLAALGATGAFGVNLFFLLSSYLITELLIRERARFGHVDLKAFYVRRILRIWPLYFAFLALAWAMQWFVPGQHIGWRAGLAFTFLGGNWWLVFVGFPSSVIFPLWSVSIEEQFYILWPALMRRLREQGIIIAALLMLLTANLVRWYLAVRHTWESKLWANTFVQLDAIALGILLAVLLCGIAPALTRLHRAALYAGGFTCLVLAGNYFQIKGDPLTISRVLLGYPTMAIGAVALFLATLRSSARLSRNPFVYLGRISYGLYVFHVLGLMISDYTVPRPESSLSRYLLRDATALAITIAFSAVSYRWLETPFLNLKQRFTHVLSRPGG
jgi:peptidoglycan/LPS O-acetylase OafA/YrhL